MELEAISAIAINTPEEKKAAWKQVLAAAESIRCQNNPIGTLSQIVALIHDTFKFWWVGFYVDNGSSLVIGPYQGPLACDKIDYAKGVCGYSYSQKKSVIVPDVDAFPGHIACSAASKSELVVPLIFGNKALGVLDIDSEYLNHFDEIDQAGAEKLCQILVADFQQVQGFYINSQNTED